jgi:hypothetical protein
MLATFATAGATAGAQTRPLVAVSFKLVDSTFRRDFSDAELTSLERAFADTIAHVLSDRVAFLRFNSPPAGPTRTLVVSVDKKDRSSKAKQVETGFYLRLTDSTGVAPTGSEIYWRMFRPLEAYTLPRGDPETFIKELQSRFSEDAESIQDLVRAVPIATQATFWKVPGTVAWIMPFKRRDLCMDQATTLRVANVLHATPPHSMSLNALASDVLEPAPDTLRALAGNIVGYPTDTNSVINLNILMAAPPGAVTVEGVFINHYHKSDAACAAPTAPDSAGFPGAGGTP